MNTYGTNGTPSARYPYEIALLQKFHPDIMGCQEVNNMVRQNVLEKIDPNYANAVVTLPDGKTNNYTPIVYRKDKFTLVAAAVTMLDSRYTETNTKSITYAVFDCVGEGRRFAVINLHGAIILESYGLTATNGVEGAAWRKDNVRQMLELMATLKKTYGDIPFLFTGDFNCNNTSEAYKLAISGGLHDAEFSSTDSHCTGYNTTHVVGSQPTTGSSIDHIFATSQVEFRVHNIILDSDAMNATDHCVVYADFVLFKK
jgi:endonuclease/exonuclease/phosphatase family metal-dependent hydrolase